MKWVGESKTCSRESVAKGLAKGCYNLNKSSEWFLPPLSSCSSSGQARRTFGLKGVSAGHESKRFGMEHVLLNISFHTPFHTCGTACLFAVPYPSFHTYGFLVYNCSRFNQNVRFAC